VSQSRLPLIARARRHLLLVARTLALVIIAKSALVATCVADGVVASGEQATIGASVASSASDYIVSGDVSNESPCWHGGDGGCHCNCMHATVLPTATAGLEAHATTTAQPPPSHDPAHPVHTAPSLRPPIA
jgi:hypothetical protein